MWKEEAGPRDTSTRNLMNSFVGWLRLAQGVGEGLALHNMLLATLATLVQFKRECILFMRDHVFDERTTQINADVLAQKGFYGVESFPLQRLLK